MAKGMWKPSMNLMTYLIIGVVFLVAIIAVLNATGQIKLPDMNVLNAVSWMVQKLTAKLV